MKPATREKLTEEVSGARKLIAIVHAGNVGMDDGDKLTSARYFLCELLSGGGLHRPGPLGTSHRTARRHRPAGANPCLTPPSPSATGASRRAPQCSRYFSVQLRRSYVNR